MKSNPLSQDKNLQFLLTDIGGVWYMKKMSKKLLALKKYNISKKSQEKGDKIKRNIQTYNRNWNCWKFQIHWNMSEWVNPRSNFFIKKPI